LVRAVLSCLFASSLIAAGAIAAPDDPPAAPRPAPTSGGALSTPAEIDKACDAAEKRVATHKQEPQIFGLVPPEDGSSTAKGTWRSFSSREALERATPDGPPDEQAFVSPAGAGVVFVELFSTSDSGDWARFADLCYRPDGTLARAVDTFNTFAAGDNDEGISRVHILQFDARGQMIRKRSRLLDLQTRKPVKRSFMDEKDRIFKRLSDLPFSDLLSQPPR
jgi:hypothetical protein